MTRKQTSYILEKWMIFVPHRELVRACVQEFFQGIKGIMAFTVSKARRENIL